MIQKFRHLHWPKKQLKWTEAKWKAVLCSDESKFEIVFGKHGLHLKLKRTVTILPA